MNDLEFAHTVDVRRKAKQSLDVEGSYRKASKATGVPKSTLAYWKSRGYLDNLPDPRTAPDPEKVLDVPISISDLKPTSQQEEPQPDGYPESLADIQDGTQAVDAPLVSGPDYPAPDDLLTTDDTEQDWFPTTPQGLQAFQRYTNALLAGGRPGAALSAAQVIDPDFQLSITQHTRLLDKLSTLLMSETDIPTAPTSRTIQAYNRYSMDDNDIDKLAQTITHTMVDAYTSGINAQLNKMNRPTIPAVTNPQLLFRLQSQANMAADGVARTYNSALATHVGMSGLLMAEDPDDDLEELIQGWLQTWSENKSSQIAKTQATKAYNSALQDWQMQNQNVEQARIIPDDAQCEECNDAVQEYGDWSPADEVMGSVDLPAHPGCVHTYEFSLSAVPADLPIWDGT